MSGNPLLSQASPRTGSLDAEFDTNDAALLRTLFSEAIAPWDDHDGKLIELTCVWLKDAIAHSWVSEATWYSDCQASLAGGAEMWRTQRRDLRRKMREEEELQLDNLAMQVAFHSRFREATSGAKREYMVSQLFPDLSHNSSIRFTARGVAERAALIHWWEAGPEVAASQAEQARQRYRQGASLRQIAVELKMAESNVRLAIRQNTSSGDKPVLSLWDDHSDSPTIKP